MAFFFKFSSHTLYDSRRSASFVFAVEMVSQLLVGPIIMTLDLISLYIRDEIPYSEFLHHKAVLFFQVANNFFWLDSSFKELLDLDKISMSQ